MSISPRPYKSVRLFFSEYFNDSKYNLKSKNATLHCTLQFADQGIRNVKDTIRRAAKYKATIENAGGNLVGEYYTFGKYDIVTIVDPPGGETMMSVLLAH